MITTFVESQTGERRNFYVTAEDPAGDWSDPIWLEGAPGIDPSFFFDDDGTCYFTANRQPPSGQQYPKHMEIWLQEVDLEHGKLVGDRYSLWDGALKQIHAQEAPHIYKRNGYYYLIIAEGGTGHTHSVTVARSKTITGPYENCKLNPILTHRHLGRDYPIVNVGHADIVETQDGEWWMVALASRPYGGYYRNLGRETFLVPFRWEDDWPLVNPGKGIIEIESKRPSLPEHRWPTSPACDHFESTDLDQCWNFIRTPHGEFWSLTERPGYLRLKLKPETINTETNPSFIGRRQQHLSFAARCALEFHPSQEQEVAGIVLLQNHNFQYRVELSHSNKKRTLQLIKRDDGNETLLAQALLPESEKLYLKVEAIEQDYHFYYATAAEQWETLKEYVDGRILSTDVAGGFVGSYIGMYASSQGKESESVADFDWFEYREI